jgi:tartrate-resistant acid phosphatase type 5
MSPNEILSRRRFLRQSFAFSALAGFGALPVFADSKHVGSSVGGSRLLMIGDWGYENFEAQARVAKAMQGYVPRRVSKQRRCLC